MVVLSVSDGIDLTAVHFQKKNIDVSYVSSTLRVRLGLLISWLSFKKHNAKSIFKMMNNIEQYLNITVLV